MTYIERDGVLIDKDAWKWHVEHNDLRNALVGPSLRSLPQRLPVRMWKYLTRAQKKAFLKAGGVVYDGKASGRSGYDY